VGRYSDGSSEGYILEDLIDIQGLDHIGMWPLAWGWWLVITIVMLGVSAALVYLFLRMRYRKSWQYQAFIRLHDIQQKIPNDAPKTVLQNLSLELRKIAMLTTQRDQCAGLIGMQWLRWLHDHDPSGFNWTDNGRLLIEAQYMPQDIASDPQRLNQLIEAAKVWVQKC
jgi:hypothetical protein